LAEQIFLSSFKEIQPGLAINDDNLGLNMATIKWKKLECMMNCLQGRLIG
jgi:hypothetical protein